MTNEIKEAPHLLEKLTLHWFILVFDQKENNGIEKSPKGFWTYFEWVTVDKWW